MSLSLKPGSLTGVMALFMISPGMPEWCVRIERIVIGWGFRTETPTGCPMEKVGMCFVRGSPISSLPFSESCMIMVPPKSFDMEHISYCVSAAAGTLFDSSA